MDSLPVPMKVLQIQRAATHSLPTSPKSLYKANTLYGGPYARRRTPNLVYIFAGAGILSYQPILIRDGGPRPIDTVNGPGITPVMPFGIGYQYRFSTRFSLGAEFGWRYTFTDYLD